MQFGPVMARRVEAIVDAQRARGLLGRGIPWNAPTTLLGPLLIQSFKLADELAEAMEARGFGAPHRNFLRHYRWGVADVLLVAASVILCMLLSYV
jgi:energy-coupling factor transport system permease protein